MLSVFDWLRQSRTGAELLATLRYFSENPDVPSARTAIGPPHTATGGPCRRCRLYPRAGDAELYCEDCSEILRRANGLSIPSRHAAIIWGFVNQVPEEVLQWRDRGRNERLHGIYIRDSNHFLAAMNRRHLRAWLQDLMVYYGLDLRGILQVFPTMGVGAKTCMGDILCRAVHQDLYMPMGQMHVHFYSNPFQLLNPQKRDRQGMLTFEVSDLLNLLEMAEIFRALLRPEEQQELFELLKLEAKGEAQFYWGRFLGRLEQRTRDMLTAWKMRQWEKSRVRIFYELLDYANFFQED